MKEMNTMNDMKAKTMQDSPDVRMTIDGMVYEIQVHFNPESKETLQKKIERMLRDEVKSLDFTEDSEGVLKSP